MEFDDDQENNCSRNGQQIFGAIFMANRSTKEECLQRMLFGLPSLQVNFVKKVKSGMILFLFEFEEKKLYGVFQASSDGAVNIVPDAYKSFGKQFPAQVRIERIWLCDPLFEDDFHDAIKDNYYTSNKFNQGLSKDQVFKLLLLFDSRRSKTPSSRSPLPRKHIRNGSMRSDFGRIVSEDDEHKRIIDGKNRLAMRSDFGRIVSEDDNHKPSFGCKNRLAMRSEDDEHKPSNNSRSSGVLCRDSSSIGVDLNTSAQAFSSVGQVVPFHVDSDNSSLLTTGSGGPPVGANLGDFIPLDPPDRFDPIISTGHERFGRENEMPSLGPGKDPPYVPDYRFPAALQHEESPYQFSVERGNDDGAYIGLRADNGNKRASVFSRLKRSRNNTKQDEENCRGKKNQDEMSLNQVVEMLNWFEKQWTTPITTTKRRRDNVRISEVAEEEQQYYDVLVEETAVNFKRRNRSRKTQGEVEEGTLTGKRRKLLRPSFVIERAVAHNGVADNGAQGNGNEDESGNTETCEDKGDGGKDEGSGEGSISKP